MGQVPRWSAPIWLLGRTDGKYQYSDLHKGTRYGIPRASLSTAILAIWTLALLGFSHQNYQSYRHQRSLEVFSPMQDSIEYEVRRFTQGLWDDHSVFQGAPNETNSAAWKEVSKLGIIKLDDGQMSQLSMSSVRYTRDPAYWAGAVEMFHQLHCLNHLRMHVWAEVPEVFHGRDPTKDEGAAHIDHCIDHIRQALMCQGSTDIITFRHDHKNRMVPNFDGPHLCRKYEPLAAWAREHKAWNMTPEGEQED